MAAVLMAEAILIIRIIHMEQATLTAAVLITMPILMAVSRQADITASLLMGRLLITITPTVLMRHLRKRDIPD